MSARSGIEMLEEILDRLDVLEKRMDIIDNNIKTLINGSNLAKLISKAADAKLENWSQAMKTETEDEKPKGFKNFGFQPVDASKLKGTPPAERKAKSTVTNNIMVTGKLKIDRDGKTVPLSGASVTIYDVRDKVVKKTKTNRAGHWMSLLQPGKYVALFEGELDGKKLLPQNRNFEVPAELPAGQKEMEVL